MKPSDIPLIDYAVNIGIALLGGAVKFAREWQMNYTSWVPGRVAIEGFIAAALAGFVGVLTFFVCTSWKVDPLYTAFAVGMMGHMGPEGISLLKDVVSNALRSRNATPPSQG